jgi:inhibitor of cysteine peptidase
MNIRMSLVLVLLAMALLLIGCGSPAREAAKTVGLSEQGGGCGTAVELNAGDTLELVLDGNPTTGYAWEGSFVAPTALKPVGEPAFKAGAGGLGAGGTYTFRFNAVAEGQATLKLIYHRPFEPEAPPLKTCDVTVVVR